MWPHANNCCKGAVACSYQELGNTGIMFCHQTGGPITEWPYKGNLITGILRYRGVLSATFCGQPKELQFPGEFIEDQCLFQPGISVNLISLIGLFFKILLVRGPELAGETIKTLSQM